MSEHAHLEEYEFQEKTVELLETILKEIKVTQAQETALLAAVASVQTNQQAEAAAVAQVAADITAAVTVLTNDNSTDPQIDAATTSLTASATALQGSATSLNSGASSLAPFLPPPPAS